MANVALRRRPVALIILDGFGYSPQTEGNAISLARTPYLDRYLETYAHTLIQGAGERVGLPGGSMGNSEVGHLNLGAGRVVPMEITRIDEAIAGGASSRTRSSTPRSTPPKSRRSTSSGWFRTAACTRPATTSTRSSGWPPAAGPSASSSTP